MFSTEILDRKIEEHKEAREREREEVLGKIIGAFPLLAEEFSFSAGYVIGSVIEPYRFFPDSDVDIAVEGLRVEDYFRLMSALSSLLERDVDLIEIDKCKFADSIRKRGLTWKRQS